MLNHYISMAYAMRRHHESSLHSYIHSVGDSEITNPERWRPTGSDWNLHASSHWRDKFTLWWWWRWRWRDGGPTMVMAMMMTTTMNTTFTTTITMTITMAMMMMKMMMTTTTTTMTTTTLTATTTLNGDDDDDDDELECPDSPVTDVVAAIVQTRCCYCCWISIVIVVVIIFIIIVIVIVVVMFHILCYKIMLSMIAGVLSWWETPRCPPLRTSKSPAMTVSDKERT